MDEKDYKEYCELLKNISPQEANKRLAPLIEWVVDHTPQKLFKFRTCNENNISAFRRKQIWFATGSQMNDDFDALLYCDKEKIFRELNSLFDEDGNLKILTFFKKSGIIPTDIKNQLSEEYIDIAYANLQKATPAELKELSFQLKTFIENGLKTQLPCVTQLEQNLIKFSSFSEDICSPLMWGHYADNSTGFALAYDFRNGQYNECAVCEQLGHTCFYPKDCVLYPIMYEDKMLNATDFARYSMQQAVTQQLLMSKGIQQPLFGQIMSTVMCSDIFMQTKIVLQKSKHWQPEKAERYFQEKREYLQ